MSQARFAPAFGAQPAQTKPSAPQLSQPGAAIAGENPALEASTKVSSKQGPFQTVPNLQVKETLEPKHTSAKLVATVADDDGSIVSGTPSHLTIDEGAKQLARDHQGLGWKGVPNLAISDDSETVKVPERMPRQTMYLKEVKGPLFTNHGRESLWTPAEILGWHQSEFLRYPRHKRHDIDRLKADVTLEVMMKRVGKGRFFLSVVC